MKKQFFALALLVSVALNAQPRKRIKVSDPNGHDRVAEALWVVASMDERLGNVFRLNDYSAESVMQFAGEDQQAFLANFESRYYDFDERSTGNSNRAIYHSRVLRPRVAIVKEFLRSYAETRDAGKKKACTNSATYIANRLYDINRELEKLT